MIYDTSFEPQEKLVSILDKTYGLKSKIWVAFQNQNNDLKISKKLEYMCINNYMTAFFEFETRKSFEISVF